MESERPYKTSQLLANALAIKQKRNPAYSRRAMARDLGVSAAFVTKILTGDKEIPPARLKKIFKVLEMDLSSQAAFMRATVLNSLPSSELKNMARLAFSQNAKIDSYKREPTTKFGIIRHWYIVAILDYLTCESLASTEQAIAAYFGITPVEVSKALKLLEKDELIENKNGRWNKKNNYTYFPVTKSHIEIREFHKQMIQKAFQQLSKITSADYEQRQITGFTIAVNPDHLETAKRMIVDFLGEISNTLSEGHCKEVYQCNIQLFPLRAPARSEK